LTLFVTQPRAVLIGSSARAATSDTYRQLNLFGDVFERVRSDYVEKPDDSKLVESAISGMLTGLDPHSSYMDAKSFRDMQVQTREGMNREISNLSSELGDMLKGFIIDLRNNPGGLLEEAVTVSDAFLERGEIVSTRGRNAEETQRRAAHAGDLTKGKPVIVLI